MENTITPYGTITELKPDGYTDYKIKCDDCKQSDYAMRFTTVNGQIELVCPNCGNTVSNNDELVML